MGKLITTKFSHDMKDNKQHNSPKPVETPQLGVFGVGNSASLTESQIEHQIEMDEEEDSYWMDDDDESEILGYQCGACGNIQNHESGFGCDVCFCHSFTAWYG